MMVPMEGRDLPNPELDPAPAAGRGVRLVDCGDGRRLDRLGQYLLDRPAPAADDISRGDPEAWPAADSRFVRRGTSPGAWNGPRPPDGPWEVEFERLRFELRLTDSGGVGLFLEQVPMWRWIRDRIRDVMPAHGIRRGHTGGAVRRGSADDGAGGGLAGDDGRPAILNLFGHTGGATLAAASAGASVVHVDASRIAVAWARRNAELSGLADAPIRWLVEDVEAFVARELRRDRRYDGVILDPPTYGHGPRREQWRLEDRLPDLLRTCAALVAGRPAFLLLTAHTPGFGPERLRQELALGIAPDELRRGRLQSGDLEVTAESGSVLPAGAYARWAAR
jgi:23S rRNA (cytosine1962-C5)-methyltransferase